MEPTVIEPTEIDELGDYEEPAYLPPLSRKRITVQLRYQGAAKFRPVPDADDYRERPESVENDSE